MDVRRLYKLNAKSFGLLQTAERAITADLEFLISKAVDPKKADYAVVTGNARPLKY